MKVALLGFGTVGKGVYDIINNELPDIEIKYVMVKDKAKHQEIKELLIDDFDIVVQDKEIDVVIEVIGGVDYAYQFVKEALKNKLHVVTANKALISKCYKELEDLAKENNVCLRYEASVGAGIIIIDELKTLAKLNKINKIEGIINGSTNYILSKVFNDNYSLEVALKEAQELGYIEEDPKDDLDGFDLMRKIHILSTIAYEKEIEVDSIERIPFSIITQEDIDSLKKINKMYKYLAKSEYINDKVTIEVKPVVIEINHKYAKINYEENIIDIYGKYHDKQSFIGKGAGRYPTASAVVYDLLKIKELK
mgnify:CR=1 FL=1